jgi:hypothetical protein
MAVPKGFRTDINIHQGKIGPERRQEILNDIANKGTFLPKGVSEEDMDAAFIEFVDKDLSISVDGQKVPVNFFTIQRWQEFSKTWGNSDKYKNMLVPFITIVRKPDIQEGTNQAGLWNIPGDRTYTYMKIPTNDGSRRGIDVYKVPQPTPVDITYEVRLITNRMKDLNMLNNIVRRTFQARQHYINVKGHPMPIVSESTGDESNIDDFESRRYYVIMYEMKLIGYLLNEKDFEVIPTINRAVALLELDENRLINTVIFDPVLRGDNVTYSIVFKPRSESQFSFMAPYDMVFNQLVNIENISRIVISVNNVSVFDGTVLTTPITIQANDTVTVRIYKNLLLIGKFQLLGNTI